MQFEKEKSSYGLNWLQKDLWYDPEKLDNKLPQNVEIVKFFENPMKTWKVELPAGKKSLAEAKIPRGIFQGDSLSPSLFCNSDNATQLRKCTTGYKISKSQGNINHLMYIKQSKNENIRSRHWDVIWHAPHQYWKAGNDTWWKERNWLFKKKLEHSEEMKNKNTCEYWKLTLSNKKKKKTRISYSG